MAPINVCVIIRGELAIGRIFAPHTSHEGGTVKRLFFGFSQFFVRSGKGRSSSRRLRSGSRSARKGSRDRNASEAWRLAALASLVFRSALTPEHAEGR